MVNKPCSRFCVKETRLPSAYRSHSAGSLSRHRISPGCNYVQYLFGKDLDDPELERELRRPAVIQEDLCQMDRRKRVREILQHKEFCLELENAIRQDRHARSQDPLIIAPPSAQTALNGLHNIKSTAQVKPVADLTNTTRYSTAERIFRNKLACLYRLVDLFQWSQGIYNHITLRLPQRQDEKEEILINPFGLLYNEITASSLIKISLEGDILDNGSTSLGINKAGYVLHSAIHAARPDVKCVLHLHTPVVSAVSSMRSGLLPICQEAIIVGPVSYHDFQGIVSNEEERESIVKDLGDKNVMILRNHGFVVCGQSVEDALHLAFHVIIAAETQIRAARVGVENLIIPGEEAVEKAYKTARSGGGGVNKISDRRDTSNQWGIGELEWEAWMRTLDSAGFKTGHVYRKPALKFRMEQSSSVSSVYLSEIATPPMSISRGRSVEAYSADTMSKSEKLRKQLERVNWLNSPNNYMKIHVLDCNSDNPRTVTKWIAENPPRGGTPIKISSAHQFNSLNGDAAEFRDRQRQLKDARMAGKNTPGPASQFLDYSTNDQLNQADEGQTECKYSSSNRQPHITYTASKGVLEREHRNEEQLKGRNLLQNPFMNESDNNIQAYLKEVGSKQRSTSAMEQTRFSYNIDSPPDSPGARERSKSFEFDAASLMQAVHFNSYKKDSTGDYVEGPIEVPREQSKRRGRKGFRMLFSFGKKKKEH